MRRPLFWLLIAFLIGLLLSLLLKLNKQASMLIMDSIVIIVLFVIVSLLAIIILVFRSNNSTWSLSYTFILLMCVSLITGTIYGLTRIESIGIERQIKDREIVSVVGVVNSVWHTPSYKGLLLKSEDDLYVQLRIYHDEHMNDEHKDDEIIYIIPGMVIDATGQYRAPSLKRNPGGFDEQRYFWLQGWDGKLITEYNQIEVIGTHEGVQYKLRGFVYNTKVYYQNIINSYMENREFAIVNALVLGDRGYIDFDTRDQIRNLGLAHLFALSGLHVGIIIVVMIFFADRLLFITRERAYVILLVLLPVYAILTGASPSVVRAVIMAMLMLIALLINKKGDVYTNLILAAFVIILFEPKLLLAAGFQLTFIITAGIVLFMPIIDYMLRKAHLSWPWLRNFVAITISAQILAFPLLVYYFQEFAWSVFISQFFILPIISFLILPAGIMLLMFGWIHPALTVIPGYILKHSASLMLSITDGFEFATRFVSSFPEISIWWVLIYFAGTVFMGYLLYYKRYHVKAIVINSLFLIVVIAYVFFPKLPTGELHITLIDVGQGDAIHIETPKGKHILIDGGGIPGSNYDIGKHVVLPYLNAIGVRHLDIVFLSHADYDHIQGLFAVLVEHSVGSLIYGYDDPRPIFQELKQLAERSGVELYQVTEGDKIIVDDIVFEILYPKINKSVLSSPNETSMVKLLTYYDVKVLFTGDIEAETEMLLYDTLYDLQVDILKVAHHGSRTSSTELFLQQVSPEYAAISVGKYNRFGHPNQQVLDNLHNIGAEIYRTDEQGAIHFQVSQNDVIVNTMLE
ncbi:DNA internalization-related competence protein ComEC/Rec2 [Desulfuribacillus alkaliarsenatis]|uniref:DNA internalization-related competence protein ComEC/Rec2 n=1 Tax=Desulfuribacillus alkaliarsenatis TaxID=766136 RepID=A0A1E5G0L6_9FIRM|nr:DNA internalization-related competence protein ComEC/Rec2 [Desulfuribacillus alkaliarsenatis]OEF96249.1 DNA internalization-related competence protein ComEC/Rec2 [Desulfuribacillus alkaliarsenatis]